MKGGGGLRERSSELRRAGSSGRPEPAARGVCRRHDRIEGDSPPTRGNPSQREAVAIAAAAADLAIIHGPPGTGKTTTLVATVRELLKREHQVLVCAPSNVAVDLLAERLHAVGLRVVRTGHISRVNEELLDLTLDM